MVFTRRRIIQQQYINNERYYFSDEEQEERRIMKIKMRSKIKKYIHLDWSKWIIELRILWFISIACWVNFYYFTKSVSLGFKWRFLIQIPENWSPLSPPSPKHSFYCFYNFSSRNSYYELRMEGKKIIIIKKHVIEISQSSIMHNKNRHIFFSFFVLFFIAHMYLRVEYKFVWDET